MAIRFNFRYTLVMTVYRDILMIMNDCNRKRNGLPYCVKKSRWSGKLRGEMRAQEKYTHTTVTPITEPIGLKDLVVSDVYYRRRDCRVGLDRHGV